MQVFIKLSMVKDHFLCKICNMLWTNIFAYSNKKFSALSKFCNSFRCSILLSIVITSSSGNRESNNWCRPGDHTLRNTTTLWYPYIIIYLYAFPAMENRLPTTCSRYKDLSVKFFLGTDIWNLRVCIHLT